MAKSRSEQILQVLFSSLCLHYICYHSSDQSKYKMSPDLRRWQRYCDSLLRRTTKLLGKCSKKKIMLPLKQSICQAQLCMGKCLSFRECVFIVFEISFHPVFVMNYDSKWKSSLSLTVYFKNCSFQTDEQII